MEAKDNRWNDFFDYFWIQLNSFFGHQYGSNYVLKYISILFIIWFETPFLGSSHEIADAFYFPPRYSLANLSNSFPNEFWVKILSIFNLFLLLIIAFSKKTRFLGLLWFLIILYLKQFTYSFGKIDHDFINLLSFFILCFYNWELTVKNSVKPSPLGLILLVLAFGMFTAGLPKAVNWIDLNLETSGFYTWFIWGYFTQDRTKFLADTIPYFPNFLTETLDYLTVIFETSLIFIVFFTKGNTKFFIFWLYSALAFHLASLLFINISFLGLTIPYLALFSVQKRNINKLTKLFFLAFIAINILSQIYAVLKLNYSFIWFFIAKCIPSLHFHLYFWLFLISYFVFEQKKFYLRPKKMK